MVVRVLTIPLLVISASIAISGHLVGPVDSSGGIGDNSTPQALALLKGVAAQADQYGHLNTAGDSLLEIGCWRQALLRAAGVYTRPLWLR
jgi:hypothetical protein